ncbi:MAG: response regulator, partial [Bacteroidetes bacterium]|nr:response regulator [Bacteroidota bacterium]
MDRPGPQSDQQRIDELRRMVEQYRSAVGDLQLLNDIAVTAGTSVDLDQTLHEIVERTLKAFGGEQGAILLLTEGGDKPFKTLIRQDERTQLQSHYDILTSITGWVISREEALVVPDLSADRRFRASPEELAQIRTLLCAPIWFEGAIIGLITILNRKRGGSFAADDLQLLSIIAVQAGQLIKNADRRAEALRRMHETDAARWEADKLKELDGLKSKLFTAIAHELRTPLTLILGPLEQLLSGAGAEDPRPQYALMQQQATRLLRRVNDLLALSTIDAGVMTL